MTKTAVRRKSNTRRRATARRVNTALVLNPSRGLSVGRGPARKSSARRSSNPRRKVASAVANPRHHRRRRPSRRRNPASSVGLIMAAFMTAIGVVGFNLVARRLPVGQSFLTSVAVKAGGAVVFQTYGHKIPVIGKYSNEIALVLAALAAADVVNQYLVPPVASALSGWGLNILPPAPTPAAVAASSSGGTTSGINGYGYRRPVVYA